MQTQSKKMFDKRSQESKLIVAVRHERLKIEGKRHRFWFVYI